MKVASDAIAGGEVELAEGTLETGSARLQVEDANVSAAKEAAFESEAEDAGYEIDSYLGISLDQVFYKGTGNSDDVWTNSMEDLENAVREKVPEKFLELNKKALSWSKEE